MGDSINFFKNLNPNVSRETIEKLSKYRELILEAKINLISKGDKEAIWIRHFHDSLRLLKFINTKNISIIDIGSGAGLPGIPLALCLNHLENKVFLCESVEKKANFLMECIEKLGLENVEVIHERVENINNIRFEYILSRAVSQLSDLFSMSYNIRKEKTIYLLHKGVHIDDEIAEATKYWDFDYELHENEHERGSYIFESKNIIKSNS
jgi:16S rRNA (guanine527-N7)-methyltransferase